ncbi:MAG: hypothetical protein MUC36_04250 [Planctomycetes bacterium]|jgi:cytochrome c peroxidase|nr:hypothetical protein [Planctomycetota bacterium]
MPLPLIVVCLLSSACVAQSILPPPPVPPGNPMAPDKVLLGKILFWEEQLSSSRSIACGSCHLPGNGGTDPRAATSLHPGLDGVFGSADDVHGSPGVVHHDATFAPIPTATFGMETQVTRRRAGSMINAAYATTLFADGRATGTFRDPVTGAIVLPTGGALESQITEPPTSAVEMGYDGRTWNDVAGSLATMTPLGLAHEVPDKLAAFINDRSYPQLFADVFGSPGITPQRIIFAIAAYERTLVSDQSRFDRYLAGQLQLTPLEQQGLQRFQVLCASCHTDLDPSVLTTGPVLADFRNIGVRPVAEDLGRQEVTGNSADRGKFRVTGLRNVALRTRFFHNGGASSLTEVLDFYQRGGDFTDNLDPLIPATAAQMTAADHPPLLALLSALTDPRVANEQAPFDRPTLWLEGPLLPRRVGIGTGGTYPMAPRATSVGPAYFGNDVFGIGMDRIAPWLICGVLVNPVGQEQPIPVLGHWLNVSPIGPQILPLTLSLPAANGGSYANWVFHVPPSSIPPGVFWFQWFALDPNGPNGFATANGMRIVMHP